MDTRAQRSPTYKICVPHVQVNETRTGEKYDVPYMRIDDEKLFLKRKRFDTPTLRAMRHDAKSA